MPLDIVRGQYQHPAQNRLGVLGTVCFLQASGKPPQQTEVVGVAPERLFERSHRTGGIAALFQQFGKPDYRRRVFGVAFVGVAEAFLGRGAVSGPGQQVPEFEV